MNLREFMPGYWVSDDGVVFKELPQFTRGTATHRYPCVAIKKKKYDVHRLVAGAFIPNPEAKLCVCHRDDDTRNNTVSNLWWGTHKENMQDMINKGRNRMFDRLPDKLAPILDALSAGKTLRAAAESIGITESRASQIVTQYRLRLARRQKAKVSDLFS